MTNRTNEALLAELIAGARNKRINRRTFMEGAMMTGAGVAGASALWGSKVHAQTPNRGGTFRVGVHDGNTTDLLDPGVIQAVFEIQISHCHRSYLTEITNENKLGPDLAVAWEAQPGAAEWRFELAPDVTFHSGKTMTTEDVIASLNHHRGENTTSAAAALLADVTDIQADGDNAIVITLASGNADLPYLLSDYHLADLPGEGRRHDRLAVGRRHRPLQDRQLRAGRQRATVAPRGLAS